jgi:hypothetical protein
MPLYSFKLAGLGYELLSFRINMISRFVIVVCSSRAPNGVVRRATGFAPPRKEVGVYPPNNTFFLVYNFEFGDI